VKYVAGKDELGGDGKIIRLFPVAYTGIISKATRKPVIAFQGETEDGDAAEVIGIEFESLDDLKEFLATIEKKVWELEHKER